MKSVFAEVRTPLKRAAAHGFPPDWSVELISDVCKINPSNDTELPSPETEVSFVPMDAVATEGRGISRRETAKIKDVERGYTKFRENDVLFAKITPCLENGKSAIARTLVRGIGFGSTEFHVLRPGPQLTTDWLFYWVIRRPFRAYAASHFTGSVGQQRVQKGFFDNATIALPPIPEQRKIAEILSTADNVIQKTDDVLAELKRLKKGLMQRLLTRGIGHNKFKKTELGEIPQSWTVIQLGDLLQEVRYGTSRKANTSGQGYPVIGTPNVLGGELDIGVIRHVELPEHECKSLTLKYGDILLVRTNANPRYIGRCAMFPSMQGTWVYASYLIRIRPDPAQIFPPFLVKFLQSRYVRKQFEEMAKTSAGNHNINTQEIRSIKIAVPSFTEQRDISAVLSELDKKVYVERKRRDEQSLIKDGLFQKLLTGQIRVKEARNGRN